MCSLKKVSVLKIIKYFLVGFILVIIFRIIVVFLECFKLEYIFYGNTEGMYLIMYRIFITEGFFGFWRGNILNFF